MAAGSSHAIDRRDPLPRLLWAALERLDASLLSLLLYTYPVLVTVTAIALGREPASRRTALLCTAAAFTLTLAGFAGGDLDPASVSAASFAWLSGLVFVAFGGSLTPAQLAGGALVLVAALAVRARPTFDKEAA